VGFSGWGADLGLEDGMSTPQEAGGREGSQGRKAARVSLLDKAQASIEMSEELLLAGEAAGSLECALEAAKYLRLIRLLRRDAVQDCADKSGPYSNPID
jgi:hypothetical protein